MLKLFQFWTRRQDMTHEQAVGYLRDVHAAHVARTVGPAVLRYVSNVGMPANYSSWIPAEAPTYDAVAEFWCAVDDVAELEDVVLSNQAVRSEEETRFIGTAQLMVAEQVVHVDRGRPHAGVKTMFLLTRRPELTRDEAMAYWHEHHAPLVRETLGEALVRYATNIGVGSSLQGWPDETSPYDGIAELWLDLSMDEMMSTVAAAAPVLLPDERAFLGTYRWLAVDEVVHVGDVAETLPAAVGISR